jgi:hypothetical protein
MDHVRPDAAAKLLQEARLLTGGDARATLALLQGCYVEEAIRVAIEEQPSGRQLAAVHAFCSVAGHRLIDAASSYGRGGASEERRLSVLGVLHDAQSEGARYAASLFRRFETTGLTRAPDDAGGHDAEPAQDEL